VPELHRGIELLLAEIEARCALLRDDPSASAGDPLVLEVVIALEAWGQGRQTHADTLNAANEPGRELALRRELGELDGREKLAARLDDIEGWIAKLRRVEALNQAYSGLATNRITSKQRELSEIAVTGVLGTKLTGELRNLHCQHMPIELHPETAVGETQVALRLAGAHGAPSVSEILSEGEQRALALAFFVAEVGTSPTDGGIIIDDPVSSLDDERRAYIARRLVAEAGHRQVVVLTHDLPFMLDLLDQADKVGLEPMVEGVWRLGSEVGRVDDHPPFKAMKLKARVGVLTEEVAQWDNQPTAADFDEEWRRVSGFYSRMRTTWERAVEERLFRGVVQRFQREVKTLALKDVEITQELVDAVEEGMTRCSEFVHDEPPGAAITLPGRQELGADLEKLRDFEKRTRG
jgi:ABC-type transport system involved in cytochrome c biogenesis ATPase subunit